MDTSDKNEKVLKRHAPQVDAYIQALHSRIVSSPSLSSLEYLSCDSLLGGELFEFTKEYNVLQIKVHTPLEAFVFIQNLEEARLPLIHQLCRCLLGSNYKADWASDDVKAEYKAEHTDNEVIYVVSYWDSFQDDVILIGIPLKSIYKCFNFPKAS